MVHRSNEGGNSAYRLMPKRTIDKPKDHSGMKISFRGSGITPALSLPCQSSNQMSQAAKTDDDEKKFYKISHLNIRNFLCFSIFNRPTESKVFFSNVKKQLSIIVTAHYY